MNTHTNLSLVFISKKCPINFLSIFATMNRSIPKQNFFIHKHLLRYFAVRFNGLSVSNCYSINFVIWIFIDLVLDSTNSSFRMSFHLNRYQISISRKLIEAPPDLSGWISSYLKVLQMVNGETRLGRQRSRGLGFGKIHQCFGAWNPQDGYRLENGKSLSRNRIAPSKRPSVS